MTASEATALIVEAEPDPRDVQLLEDRLYEFNVQAAGIDDGKWLGLFLRGPDASLSAAPTAGAGAIPAFCAICSFRPVCATRVTGRG